jgi:pantetheine-phosphate adenylyltransferase
MQVKALYPGTFDPPTNGHVDLIQRGAKIFGHLTVAVLNNRGKNPLFTLAERVEMLEEVARPLENVSVATFDGLMVEFARQQGATAVLRGIRAISDYEYEFQMALMNRRLAPEIETVFQLPHVEGSLQLRGRRDRPCPSKCAQAPARADEQALTGRQAGCPQGAPFRLRPPS